MKEKHSTGLLVGIGIISAIAASLCCILPVLALIAGTISMASAFSWLEPVRPYLIGVTVMVLGFAWYQKLKSPKANNDMACVCEGEEENSEPHQKSSFLKSKVFLIMITVFAALMISFPSYSKFFCQKETYKQIAVQSDHIRQAHFQISGMTCAACAEGVRHVIAQLPGFINASLDYKTGDAIIKYNLADVFSADRFCSHRIRL